MVSATATVRILAVSYTHLGKVFCDEVYAIEAHRKFTGNDFSSLVAILRSYIDKGIVSQRKADEIASWMHRRI